MATDGTSVDGDSCEFRSEYELAHGTLDGTWLGEWGGIRDDEVPDDEQLLRCLDDLGLELGGIRRYQGEELDGCIRRHCLDDLGLELGGIRRYQGEELDGCIRRHCLDDLVLELGGNRRYQDVESDDSFRRYQDVESDDSCHRHYRELGEMDVMGRGYFLGRLELGDVQLCLRLEDDDVDRVVRESRRSSNR
jgi:hypothetical protein